jgi:insulysin
LTEFSYPAEIAGIDFSVNHLLEGLYVLISGYNDKQHVLLQVILERIKSFKFDPNRFAMLKEQLQVRIACGDAMNE